MHPAPVLLAAALALAACAEAPSFPGPGGAAARAGPWPRLVPLGPVLARQAEITIGPEDAAGLEAEAAALRARAARLRRKVIEDAARDRLDAGIDR